MSAVFVFVGLPGLLMLVCWADFKFKLRPRVAALYYRWQLRRTQKAWERL